ncbi:uncharacterized protein LOC133927984 [Phragmites australis]|uniref:uncharacterized protein LOC133927984 n=1 Tax=Phragmites australis TaxID=29695 RepID=UPI002D7A33CB|nr:uncharacterized protein LOC133927984 [Phragmites australis]
MTSPTIQKELAKCCAVEITKAIKEEMGGCLFSVLVDESRDISVKEQMAVVVRFVSKKGELIERFLGIKHVTDTTSEALKRALVELVVVAVSRCCSSIEDFFDYVALIVNTTSSSCRRKDLLLDKHHRNLLAKLESGEMSTGRGKHQETSLARPRDTRWGSYYKTLLRIESMWDSVIEVLGIVQEDVRNPCRAGGLVHIMESFSFVLIMKMMLQILRITNELSLLLQRKDQNVVQAMSLVIDVKTRLINLRNHGWEPLFEESKEFCNANDIPIPNMDEAGQTN